VAASLAVAAAVLLCVPVRDAGQDPVEAAAKAAPKPAPVADRKEAGDILKQFRELSKKKNATLAERLQSLELLASRQSESFLPELRTVLLNDRDAIVRAEAAKALACQRFAKTLPIVRQGLELARKNEDHVVALALVEAIERLGYDGQLFDPLCALFSDEATEARVQQRVIQLFDKAAEKRAFKLLVDNLDEPAPVDVDAASNPPAEYWERRWKKWAIWKGDVAKALKNLAGIEFKEASFYRRWVRKEGQKLGLDY
jgi:hypothetical protein